jgi:hypothetical protein
MTPADIHDIRGPIAIPYWWLVPALVVVVLVVVALAIAAYRRLRARGRARVRTAAEVALERIERARELVGSGRAAEFSAELSDAVRDYIEARWSLPAAHETTEEFLHGLLAKEASPVAGHRDALEDFLSGCDLAKFARFVLFADQMTAMIAAAVRFVETTAAAKAPEEPASPEKNLPDAPAALEAAS